YDVLAKGRLSSHPKNVDVSSDGAYANYNWELLFHLPLAIAVHLSKSQRFAEAQKWFHFIFNPIAADKQYWRFPGFRVAGEVKPIDRQLAALAASTASN